MHAVCQAPTRALQVHACSSGLHVLFCLGELMCPVHHDICSCGLYMLPHKLCSSGLCVLACVVCALLGCDGAALGCPCSYGLCLCSAACGLRLCSCGMFVLVWAGSVLFGVLCVPMSFDAAFQGCRCSGRVRAPCAKHAESSRKVQDATTADQARGRHTERP